jgi:FAD/FMN-containing dehydrogenase
MDVTTLRVQCTGEVLVPGDANYQLRAQGWNTAVKLRPAVIAVAASIADVQLAVRFAADHRLKLLVQSTGHGVVQQTGKYLLLVTANLNQIRIDAGRHTAFIQAGAVWSEVLAQTTPHGLAPLLGSSGTVGVVGYTLGGGLGWLSRHYGPAVDSVLTLEVVTAAGDHVELSASDDADLRWALCGGGGSFAVVVALKTRLYPVATVWGGTLAYPLDDALPVLHRYREWTARLSSAFTTSLAIGQLPDRDSIPSALRGRRAIMLRGCLSGPLDHASDKLAFWTDWRRPILNTFAAMPFARVTSISDDPITPSPAFTVGGQTFTGLPDALFVTLARYAQGGANPFAEIELRHIRSSSTPAFPNAYSHRDAHYVLDVVAGAVTPEEIATLRRRAKAFERAVQPYASGLYLNLAATSAAVQAFDSSTLRRLRDVKHRFDPDNLFISGFSVMPGSGGILKS